MSDSETLRAAAEILRGRMQRPQIAHTLEGWADGLAAEDAAAEGDRKLGRVVGDAYCNTLGHSMSQEERWIAVARAVREAIEAEQ